MTIAESLWDKIRHWLEPVVYLSNNLLSLAGVVLVTTSVVFWLFLLPTTLKHEWTTPTPASSPSCCCRRPFSAAWPWYQRASSGTGAASAARGAIHQHAGPGRAQSKLRRLVLFFA